MSNKSDAILQFFFNIFQKRVRCGVKPILKKQTLKWSNKCPRKGLKFSAFTFATYWMYYEAISGGGKEVFDI